MYIIKKNFDMLFLDVYERNELFLLRVMFR